MSDSIREKIMKDRVTLLAGITAANGYANTILSVQRFAPSGQLLLNVPCIIVNEDDEEKIREDVIYIYKKFLVDLTLITRIDEATDTRSANEVLNSLRADVELAWMKDIGCGNNAIITSYERSGRLDSEEGQPEIGTFITFEIQFRHKRNDPYLTA